METWQILVGVAVVLVPPILNWYSSKQYRDAKDAEFNAKVTEYTSRLNSKDEKIITIKEKFDSMVASKDEQIKLYEKLSSPQIMERYNKKIEGLEKTNDELNAEIDELNQEIELISEKLKEEEERRKQLETELAGMEAPEEVRSVVNAYTSGSMGTFEQMSNFIHVVSSSGVEIQRKAEQVVNLATLKIEAIPSEVIIVGDKAEVEITGPEDDSQEGEEE